MSTNSHYEEKVSNLIASVIKIKKNNLLIHEQSDMIMEELRKEYILLPLEYINSLMYTMDHLSLFENTLLSLEWKNQKEKEAFINDGLFGKEILGKIFFQSEATIDPSKIVDESYPGETVIIRGNSFGPFNSKKYFESPIKILWILKEPLITKGTWFSKYDRGGHNQAEENNFWENMEDNPTLKHLIHITQTLLHKLDDSYKTYTEQQAMEHICVLEVNHFPGLNFNNWDSNDSFLTDWASMNKSLIYKLINFYRPTIVYFASTLELFDTDFENFKIVQEKYNADKLHIFDDKIIEWSYVYAEGVEKDILINKKDQKDSDNIIYVGRNIKYLGKSGTIYVQAYHPTAKDNPYTNAIKKDKLIGIDSTRIKLWRTKHKTKHKNRLGILTQQSLSSTEEA